MASVGCSRYQLRAAGLPIPLSRQPIRQSVAVDGDSGALVVTTFVSGRVTLALVTTRGAGVAIHTDSIGAADWADSAARGGAATLHDTASSVGTISVVDSAGFLRPETLRFLQSPDPAFSESVEAALAHSRYYPAMLGGRPVSQLVRQSFTFSLE